MVVIFGQVIGNTGHWKLSKNLLYLKTFFAVQKMSLLIVGLNWKVQMPGVFVWGLYKQAIP